ncbi:Glycosyltransferase [Candidatus Nitrospira nitrosa]|uniref:Glycosyltransferase n=1 Tax=Candidatus Nitrospira nitrosa TaxID=1742972 RepID=A0A0S4LIC7_9BACT|nr:ATP-grasp fold amidoligase family protein [Candidatus Nitrospira nitrosa]CUS34898.1 Glycosyltransferase [Candidatus Nitrospira nitrosa]
MAHSFKTIEASTFRDSLHGTWVYAIFNRLRSIKQQLTRQSDGEAILKQRYLCVHGRPLTDMNPQTFTEKLYWRMLAWNRVVPPIFVQLADKLSAREYVASKVGNKYLPLLLWHGQNPALIPFNALPIEYVVKSNHASRQVIVAREPVDHDAIIATCRKWIGGNFYWVSREGQYLNIQPQIMLEECLRDHDGNLPLDYKIWCFNGVPELIQVINFARDSHSFYDTSWNALDLSYSVGKSRPDRPRPDHLEEMISLATRLSIGFGFVRVDLYNLAGRIYFGELTFTPTAGMMKMQPGRWDVELGKKWDVSLEYL